MAEKERHPRGLVFAEVLGKKRRLRAPLSFAADFTAEASRPVKEFLTELQVELQSNALDLDPTDLIIALKLVTAAGGEQITDEELAEASLADKYEIALAVLQAMIGTGLLKELSEEAAEQERERILAERAAEGAKKKAPAKKGKRKAKKKASSSRGGGGKR